MLLPAARFMIGPESIQERLGEEKVEAKHHRDPGKGNPLQAQHRNIFGQRHHPLTETLPLHSEPLHQYRTAGHNDRSEAHICTPSTHPLCKPGKETFASRESGFGGCRYTNVHARSHDAGQEIEEALLVLSTGGWGIL